MIAAPTMALSLMLLAASPQSVAQEGALEEVSSAAEGAPEVFAAALALATANDAYEAGQYQISIENYEALLEQSFDTGLLHYNLGNAFLQQGDLGRAISSYLRASLRLPRDRDVQANLEFARQSRKDDLSPPQASAISRALFFWHYGLSRGELWRVMLISNLLFWGLLAARVFFLPHSELYRWGVALVLMPLMAAAGSILMHRVAPSVVVVVIPPEVDVRSGTSDDTEVRFEHEPPHQPHGDRCQHHGDQQRRTEEAAAPQLLIQQERQTETDWDLNDEADPHDRQGRAERLPKGRASKLILVVLEADEARRDKAANLLIAEREIDRDGDGHRKHKGKE